MRIIAHGIVYFQNPEDRNRVKELMQAWSSCRRSAYQAIHKHGLQGNDIKVYCKKNYMKSLNQRYVADAACSASMIQQEHSLFGGRRNWKKLQTGTISKKKWQYLRNSEIYSRGDKTKTGNANIRVVGNYLWINDPSERRKWIKGKLWLDKSVDLSCYDARVQLRDNKFKVNISWDDKIEIPVTTNKSNGVIGIDTNPDGLALSEINQDGNLQSHVYLKNNRIQFARSGKRDYDIKQMAIQAVSIAKNSNKSIVFEKLSFKNNKKHSRKFRRMSHNFIFSKLLNAIQIRAYKEGVEVIEVPAAYTSIVGKLKYRKMYSLSTHNAAALVIGRLDLLEKSDKVVVDVSESKDSLTLEGRGESVTLKKKSFPWFKSKFRVNARSWSCQKPASAHSGVLGTGQDPAQSTGAHWKPDRAVCQVTEPNNWSGS
jgi:IS605 OrfB family transposase